MRIPRVHLRDPAIWAASLPGEVEPDRDAARHLFQVLRLRAGHRLRVFDGAGREHDATVVDADRKHPRLRIEATRHPDTTPRLMLELIVGLPRADAMDWILQKAVELGARSIRPVVLEHSRSHGEHRGLDRRVEHWQRVMIAAAEQCGRNEWPTLHPVATLDETLAALPPIAPDERRAAALLPDDRATVNDAPAARTGVAAARVTTARVAVGPEGGFHPVEVRRLVREGGFGAVSLGPRVLRCETAAVVLLDRMQRDYGDGAPRLASGGDAGPQPAAAIGATESGQRG